MKNLKFTFILLIVITSLLSVTDVKAQSVTVNFSSFRQQLSPYGRWINNPRFGEVWIYNDAGFRPYYTDGHWEYTDYGWSWESDYDWGWAPFHYGRWEYDPYDGWMWIPGYEWASAWVSWSSCDGYYGWAPLGFGVNINVAFGAIPYNRWTFIPRRNICDRDINRYYISPERNHYFRNAVVINNYYEGNGREGRFMRGPERREVERYTNNRIAERRIDNREKEGYRGDRNRNNNDNVRNKNDNNPHRNKDVFRENENNRNQGNDIRRQNNNPGINNNRINRENNNPVQGQSNEIRRQNRENNKQPQRNDNRINRENVQQNNNFPGRQQQIERPVRDQRDQQQMQRPVMEQRNQQQTEQRKMERRTDTDNGRGNQRQNSNIDQRRRSN